MASIALGDFLDFIEATGDLYLKGRQDFQNDASQQTFFWSKLSNGLGDKMFVNGGASIKRPIMFDSNGSFAEYGNTQERTWTDNQTMQKMTEYLRYADAHFVVRDQEVLLNEGGGGDGQFHQYFNLKEQKVGSTMTELWNGVENQLFAEPSVSLMEGDGSTQVSPKSLFVYINEDTNGLHARNGTTWTSKSGIAPATHTDWDHYRDTYSSANMGSYDTILEGLDRCVDEINYEQPSSYEQYFASPAMQRCFILTSTVGRTALKYLNRNGQDTWERFGEGGIKDPTHNGIPVYRAKQMDTATVWDDGSSGNTTEALADLKGPRFMVLNGNYMHPVCHSDRYFYMDDPMRHPNDPEAYVVRYVIWHNLVATSLRHQALLSPASDLYY